MPALAVSGYRVIALDPRGMGDSDHPQVGFDLKTVAAEVHGFIAALGLAKDGRLDVVGHDAGTWLEQNRQRAQRPLSMPVLTIGGQHGVGDLLWKTMTPLATDRHGRVVDGCGHYVLEECPGEFSAALNTFPGHKVPAGLR